MTYLFIVQFFFKEKGSDFTSLFYSKIKLQSVRVNMQYLNELNCVCTVMPLSHLISELI